MNNKINIKNTKKKKKKIKKKKKKKKRIIHNKIIYNSHI